MVAPSPSGQQCVLLFTFLSSPLTFAVDVHGSTCGRLPHSLMSASLFRTTGKLEEFGLDGTATSTTPIQQLSALMAVAMGD
ncbi:hypothetical protein NLI96_g7747 [Meripilus lineatus]|uniref:Secreted protein n=1 Tax=Meripilus lineatus TaxID=2056292 RepID=A0AAD5V0H6_9APHY|nr:hypothetical protein NLI96_g7747 [Physisporinus lineatus]